LLGGAQFDERLLKYFLQLIKEKYDKDLSADLISLNKLSNHLIQAKHALSKQELIHIEIENLFDGKHFSEILTREQFEEMNHDLFEQTIKLLTQTIHHSGLQFSEIDKIILSGGSTNIPKIKQLLSNLFDDNKIRASIPPDQLVARGFSVIPFDFLHDVLMSQPDILMSIGIETIGGIMTSIIERNTRISTKKTKIFTTSQHNQTSMEIKLFEGERLFTKDNILRDTFILNLPPLPCGTPQIEITFTLDENLKFEIKCEDKINNIFEIFLLPAINWQQREEYRLKETLFFLSNETIEQLICESTRLFKYDSMLKNEMLKNYESTLHHSIYQLCLHILIINKIF
jgi:molecular chaperone DnaK (HSP70)